MKKIVKLPKRFRTWNGIVYEQDIWIDKAMEILPDEQLNYQKFKEIQLEGQKAYKS